MQFLRKILGGKIMSVLTTKPKFLYPYARQFPFDEVAENIVRAIEKRNWKVPGIAIEFDTYGSGEAKYQLVRSIDGDDFQLYFCRVQEYFNNGWNDTAALHSVYIPNQGIYVYEDGSRPTYYLYVGKNWGADKKWFMNSAKVNSKLNKEPRRYLRYKGTTSKQGTKYLIADNDFQEYSPIGNEPVRINLQEKFKEFTTWLEEHVLNYILSFPEEDTIQSPPMKELIYYEGPWSTIYSICNWNAAERIKKGRINPSDLPPEERYAFSYGLRLVHLGIRCNCNLPEIAYEGFIWCGVNAELLSEVMLAMGNRPFEKDYLIAIKLKYANEVYVADNSKYKETRQKLFKSIAPRTRLTDEELDKAIVSRGATIVPITEYKGDYKEPIVLINRELEFEEIEEIHEIALKK